jgi:hypothetical protein
LKWRAQRHSVHGRAAFLQRVSDDKRRALHQILKTRGMKQAFVFVNSKLVVRSARSLEREGLKPPPRTATRARTSA